MKAVRGCRKHMTVALVTVTAAVLAAGSCIPAHGQWAATEEAAYVERFEERFPRVSRVPSIEEYASPARYDELFMGELYREGLEELESDASRIAWGWSYRMLSLNEMYRSTGDAKYLEANLEGIRKVIALRDDRVGIPLWTGEIVPAWGSAKYARRGRAVFAVHTGLITHPMLDFLLLAEEARITLPKAEAAAILLAAEEALSVHDRQWRDGPADGEGHYVGLNQEDSLEGKSLPGNRLSAIGRALWISWKFTGNDVHRRRAIALGRYIRNRLTPAPDGAYYWSYRLPDKPVEGTAKKEAIRGEDVSHGALTMALPFLLASEGEVFTVEDMKRVGKTLQQGFGRLGDGILFGDVTGHPNSSPSLAQGPARWLPLCEFVPEVYDPIATFYVNYRPNPGPHDITYLIRYRGRRP